MVESEIRNQELGIILKGGEKAMSAQHKTRILGFVCNW
jgi:hypothetical protein